MSRDASPQRVGDAEDAHASSSVLWERRIEQSIFVDISDDESLNFSDVQGAFTVHLSQGSDAPESPKFTDNTEPSGETEESSTESAESISNERSEHKNTSNKSTNPPIQTRRIAIKPVSGKHEDDAINTSDEEHEELPYDGAHTNHKTYHDVRETKSKSSNLCETGAVMPIQDFNVGDTCQSVHKATQDVALPSAKPIQAATHITDFLLRHFSREELLNPCKMIDAETLPEISLMDSFDESVLNRVSTAPQVSSEEREKVQNKSEEPESTTAETHGLSKDLGKGMQEVASNSTKEMCIDDADTSRGCDAVSTVDDEEEDEDNYPSKADAPNPKLTFSRTRSFSEMKYGQGQVHYPLPDFSKVAPKVKIPKGNGSVKPIGQFPTIPRVQSSPGILGKSTSSCTATADVISRVLEDSPFFSDKEEQAGLAHHLQAEYDRLLAKYTETENLIGQQIHASSEPSVSINWNETICNNDNTKLTAKTPQASTAGSGVEQRSLVQNPSAAQTEAQSLSDGDRLTSELRDIINSFTQKVDEFKTCVQNMTMNVEEQQMVLKSMMEAQDQLERNYLTKREEHRALEMQNYMGISRNTGEFDPDREVEGQIFRIGMHLEDIKEQIDRNVCHLFYPPSSSSTPSHTPCNDISPSSSLHQSLHEESLFSISTVRQNMKENDEEEEDEDHRAESNFILQCCGYEEDNLTETQEEDDNEDFLTQTYTTTASLQQALTRHRCEEIRRPDENLSNVGTDIIGPSVETTTDQTQSFWSPEADSGFGSSDASRPNTGLSQTAANALSSAQSDDVISAPNMSDSDSEMSHSNVQTTISVTTRPPQSTVNHVEYEQLDTTSNYITQNAPLKGPKVEASLVGGAISIREQMTEKRRDIHRGKHHIDTQRPDRDTNSPSHCSCHNSEVILALQYEVSHLKRALEESLSHLPHMSRRVDYPNSRSHSERKHRGQTRGQNKTGSSRRVKTDSIHQTTEDWISSDTEPSKRKVTDGEDSDHRLSFQRGLSPSHEQTHGHFSALSDTRSCRSSSKASVDTSQLTSGNHQRSSNGPAIHSNSADTRSTYSSAIYRPAMGNLFINSRKLPANPSHKPLLQVNYGSSYSLPAGFKVRDRESEPPVSSRRRSTQSDSALLPSNVFFQQTSQRTGARRRYASREESIHKTLDKALQAAFLMKQTTEKMADALSADLAKAQLQRKIQGLHPINNRTARCNLLSLSTSQAH